MDVFEAIAGRRSVRRFLPDPVPKADLERMLDAARYAPTAGNSQPWKFLVVRDRARLAGLREVLLERLEEKVAGLERPEEEKAGILEQCRQAIAALFGAPVWVFLFVYTGQYPESVVCDGAMAAQNLLLAAHALGYGSSFQTSFFPEEPVRGYFGVPAGYRLIAALPIGRPIGPVARPAKKDLASFVWEERPAEETT